MMMVFVLAGVVCAFSGELYSESIGETHLSLEYDASSSSLMIRMNESSQTFRPVSRETISLFLSNALKKLPSAVDIKSIFIGRAVDYDWLVKQLIDESSTAPEWTAKRKKPEGIKLHTFVEKILFTSTALDPFKTPFALAGYRCTGVSVEKVLVSNKNTHEYYADVPENGKFPFDALISILLIK
jgi:hypothetical protein